ARRREEPRGSRGRWSGSWSWGRESYATAAGGGVEIRRALLLEVLLEARLLAGFEIGIATGDGALVDEGGEGVVHELHAVGAAALDDGADHRRVAFADDVGQ